MAPKKDKNRFKPPLRPQNDGDDDGSGHSGIGRQLLLWAIVIGGILVTVSLYKKASEPAEEKVDTSQFLQLLDSRKGARIDVQGNVARVKVRSGGGPQRTVKTNIPPDFVANHLKEWTDAGHQVNWEEDDSGLLSLILIQVAPFLLLILIMVWFFNRQMRAAGSRDGLSPFVGNSTEEAQKEKPEVDFDDVAGVEEAKEEVQEIIEFLRNPEKFRRIGGRIPRGVLLVGAPGTGKTLLAKAIAGEANAPFFSLCGSDFVELFVGVGAARVRDLFKKARQNQPAIIFLDEIDAVGRKRGTGLGGGHDEREQTLNAILSEMDGFTRDEGVIVIASTNRPDVLDPALLRPGRFDREIVVDMPDVQGREEILQVHVREVRMAGDVDLHQIARGTPGFSGADLEALVNEAAIRAAMKGLSRVRMAELEEARDKVRFGREKKRSRAMSQEDRKMTAYHEAGHALVANLHEDVEPLHKVTIIPRGVSLGMTMVLPEKDKYSMRKLECLGNITMQLAGRVSEEMFCGDISSGAAKDIKGATELARKMVTQWGMSEELGPISYSDDEEHVFLGDEITRGKNHSEQMSEKIDHEVRSVVMQSYRAARCMCEENAAELERLAECLLELETLSGQEVERIFKGAGVEELVVRREEEEEERQRARAEEEADESTDEEGDEDTATGGLPRPVGSPA
ncbi:MAG: ATP-dependent zinc metalloprotease FtsH [Planctomycetota bacterium]